MKKAIAVIEFKTVSSGIKAADTMLKTADIDVIESQTVCPGKYISVISGSLSAVRAAVEAAENENPENLINRSVLGNPHDTLFPALYGTVEIGEEMNGGAFGIFETYDVASAIRAADIAVKNALVTLVEIRIAKGMCGKSYVSMTGDVSAVDAAVSAAKANCAKDGMFLDSCVIPSADKGILKFIM